MAGQGLGILKHLPRFNMREALQSVEGDKKPFSRMDGHPSQTILNGPMYAVETKRLPN